MRNIYVSFRRIGQHSFALAPLTLLIPSQHTPFDTDYYDSSFYFHAGLFQLDQAGVTHMCAGGGRAIPPHPACGGEPASVLSEWSAFRFHAKDPLWFTGGVQLLARNGDVGAPTPYGSAKCGNTASGGGPGPSVVSSIAWVYEWNDVVE
jgi:hypothetical protein